MGSSSVSSTAVSSGPRRRRIMAWVVGLPVLLVLAIVLAATALADPRPEGTPGPEAEALARAMMEAIDHEAWQTTGAVKWSFRGSRHHLWDRQRQLARVQWDEVEILLNLASGGGRAWKGGREVEGEKAEKLVRKAYEAWVNDSFWLNPISKVFDDGTVRGLVAQDDGTRALLVEYTSGGVTPGDAYLWLFGDDDLPVGWRMWTSNIPIGGARATWERWIELDTGARIATLHDLAIGKLEMTGVAGATSLADLEPGDDPFASLLGD